MADEFDKNIQMIMGKSVNQAPQLSADDKKSIAVAYQKLFANLTYNNWLRGGTLGNAWYKTLSQMKQFIQSNGTASPAAMYMRQIFASHSAEWSKVMMTNPNRESVLDVDEKTRAKWNARTAQEMTAARESMMAMVKKYQAAEKDASSKNKTATQDAFRAAAQKMQMLMILQMRQKQNGGMAA